MLAGDIAPDQLPRALGGKYLGSARPFSFDGALLCWPEQFYAAAAAGDANPTVAGTVA